MNNFNKKFLEEAKNIESNLLEGLKDWKPEWNKTGVLLESQRLLNEEEKFFTESSSDDGYEKTT